MELSLKHGHGSQRLRLPAGTRAVVLGPGRTGGAEPEADAVRAALAQPIGSPRLARVAAVLPEGGSVLPAVVG